MLSTIYILLTALGDDEGYLPRVYREAISCFGTFRTWRLGMRVKSDVTASLLVCPLGEQLSAGRGELHVGPRFVPHHPTFVDCPLRYRRVASPATNMTDTDIRLSYDKSSETR